MQQNEESYYTRYCRTGRRFQLIGGAVLAAAVAAHLLTGGHALILLVGVVGFAALIFGSMNMRPANMIKAFAMQLQMTGDRDFAQGLLEAIEKNGRTMLSGQGFSSVQQAIVSYIQREDADKALVDALCEAAKKNLRKLRF